MIKKKEIDLRSLTINSANEVFQKHGLLKEKTVPTIPLKTAEFGKKSSDQYSMLAQIFEPIRAKAGATGDATSIESLKSIIETMNQILGTQEEDIENIKTGMVQEPEKITGTVNSASEILSSLYLYRTLYNVFKEQTAHVAGRALESVMAVLFLGYTPSGDPIQDFFSSSGEYVSLKVISSAESINGSKANLAIGLSKSPQSKVTYVVCVKDQSSVPMKINVYRFDVDVKAFFTIALDGKEFWKNGITLTDEGYGLLSQLIGLDPKKDNTLPINSYIAELTALNENQNYKKNLLQERLVDELKELEYNKKMLFVCLLDDPWGVLANDEKQVFFKNENNVKNFIEVDNSQFNKLGMSALKKYIKKLGDKLVEEGNKIPDNLFNEFFYYLERRLPQKTRAGLRDQGEKVYKQVYYKFIEDVLLPKLGSSSTSKKMLNATEYAKNLRDIVAAIDERFPDYSTQKSRVELVEYFNNYDNEQMQLAFSQKDDNFKKKLKEISSKEITKFKQLDQILSTIESPNPFTKLFKKYDEINALSKGVGLKKGEQPNVFIEIKNLLDEEFNERLQIYQKFFKTLRSELLKPFAPIRELEKLMEKHLESVTSKPQQQADDSGVTSPDDLKRREKFFDVLFKRDIEDVEKLGQFNLKLFNLPKFGIKVEEIGTIFLNEKYLFQNAKQNAQKFENYMKPIYDNVEIIKSKTDKYFLNNDTLAMRDAIVSVKTIEEHIRTKLTTDKEEIKSAEELKESLNNLTEEARIVMEMLQIMEG